MKYKMSYLTDGTKVKITDELFNQLKRWETENTEVTDYFKDELKKQDNEWINKNRQYQRNNTSLDSLISEGFDFIFIDSTDLVEEILIKKERKKSVDYILNSCTKMQKRVFVLYFFYGLGYREISRIERKNKDTIKYSIKKVLQMLKNSEQL